MTIIWGKSKEISFDGPYAITRWDPPFRAAIYAIPYDNLNNAKNGQNVNIYPACSSENSLNFKCADSCIVPLDTIYFIKNNNQDSIANVDIKLKYKIMNITSS